MKVFERVLGGERRIVTAAEMKAEAKELRAAGWRRETPGTAELVLARIDRRTGFVEERVTFWKTDGTPRRSVMAGTKDMAFRY